MTDLHQLAQTNLLDPDLLQCPFRFYAAARESAPVLKLENGPIPGRDIYFVSSFDLVKQVLVDWKTYSNRFAELMGKGTSDPEVAAIAAQGWKSIPTMLTEDPPLQRKYRALVTRAFSAARIEGMGPYITQICDELIDGFIDRGECDFLADFAIPLPIYVIADQLGVARADLPRFKAWTNAAIANLGHAKGRDAALNAARAVVELQQYFAAIIEQRRAAPTDDIISELANARFDDERLLTMEEMLSILQQLLIAGNETTTNALAGGLVHIIDGGKVDHFRDHPAELPNAIEEILRLEAPTKGMWRIARETRALGGVTVPAGAVLFLSYDSANRDARQFPAGEVCDFARGNAAKHLSFGFGTHSCIGSMLSRKQMAIAYERLFARLGDIAVVPDRADLRYLESILHRGFQGLNIRFTRR